MANSWNIPELFHWGRVTHICVGKLTIIGSENGLSPERRQAIIWNNAEILLIGPLETNFSENFIEILTFSFTKMRLKVSSAKWRPFCLGLNVLYKPAITSELKRKSLRTTPTPTKPSSRPKCASIPGKKHPIFVDSGQKAPLLPSKLLNSRPNKTAFFKATLHFFII